MFADLQLAAELSKSLLERVKELEQTVTFLQQTREEQETEIDVRMRCFVYNRHASDGLFTLQW